VPVSDGGIADWVTALPAHEKDKFLTMVAEGEGARVRELRTRYAKRPSLMERFDKAGLPRPSLLPPPPGPALLAQDTARTMPTRYRWYLR
jgi:hypothetical protein